MSNRPITRRQFVGKSVPVVGGAALAMTASSYARVSGANDRLSVGIVGCGGRMSSLMSEVHKLEKKQNCEITAVCDIWNQRREEAAKKVETWYGRAPRKCRTLTDICALEDVDALVIATADFQHASHMAFAVRHGKDVYVEKPLGVDFEQVKEALVAVRETGRIVQMGTQGRSAGAGWGARDFIKAGKLGAVTYGEIDEPLFQERWRIPGSETSLTEKDTDWKEFQSYTYEPEKAFNARHYREFRLFWPYSSGCIAQWMSHAIDAVNLALDEIPRYGVAWGGVYLWKDGRTNPDTIQCLLEYPRGCLVTYHMRLGNGPEARDTKIYGSNGTLYLNKAIATGEGGGGTVTIANPGQLDATVKVDKSTVIKEQIKYPCPPDLNHMENFLESVRTRKRTRADIEAGYGHAVACILADLSYRNGCRMEYDDKKMEVKKSPVS
jgi:predicted dehydrogenase